MNKCKWKSTETLGT